MRGRLILLLTLIGAICFCSKLFAEEGSGRVPDRVGMEHWSCKELSALAEKYGADARFPKEGEISRKELARNLLSVLERIVAKGNGDGPDAVPREERDRIAVLYNELKDELAQFEGYLVRREAIEEMLAKPEEPKFVYRAGVAGFVRGEGVGNFNLRDFSYSPHHSEGRFLYRAKPYAYWHPTDYLDIHLEGQGYGFVGSGPDYGRFYLYQGFIEGKLPQGDMVAFKAGRQEFSYGSTFILGTDSFYNGLSFDALRLRIQPHPSLTIDLLGGYYAKSTADGVRGDLSGMYGSFALSEGTAIELYLFRDTGGSDRHDGEQLYVWGGRGTATFGPLSLEVEPVYESGRRFNPATGANERVDAYGGHLDATVNAPVANRNGKLFLSYAYGSGSKDAVTGTSSRKEFRTANNDSSLMGDTSLVGDLSGLSVGDYHASGLQMYTLGWGVDISKEFNVSATGHYVVANHVPDGFSRQLGLEADFSLTYTVGDDMSVILAYDHFFTGPFFRDAAGRRDDIQYGYLMFQFNLAKTKLSASLKAP